jgi:hypothetical protein
LKSGDAALKSGDAALKSGDDDWEAAAKVETAETASVDTIEVKTGASVIDDDGWPSSVNGTEVAESEDPY